MQYRFNISHEIKFSIHVSGSKLIGMCHELKQKCCLTATRPHDTQSIKISNLLSGCRFDEVAAAIDARETK